MKVRGERRIQTRVKKLVDVLSGHFTRIARGNRLPHIQQIFDGEGSCISCFVCCPQTSKVAVIDQTKNRERYLNLAKAKMVGTTHWIDTHINTRNRLLNRQQRHARQGSGRLTQRRSAHL